MVFATKRRMQDLNGRKVSRSLDLKTIGIVGTKRIDPDPVVMIVDPIVNLRIKLEKFLSNQQRPQNSLKPLESSLNIFRDDLKILHDDPLVQNDDLKEKFKEPKEMKSSKPD